MGVWRADGKVNGADDAALPREEGDVEPPVPSVCGPSTRGAEPRRTARRVAGNDDNAQVDFSWLRRPAAGAELSLRVEALERQFEEFHAGAVRQRRVWVLEQQVKELRQRLTRVMQERYMRRLSFPEPASHRFDVAPREHLASAEEFSTKAKNGVGGLGECSVRIARLAEAGDVLWDVHTQLFSRGLVKVSTSQLSLASVLSCRPRP